jgi:hypothetical protein
MKALDGKNGTALAEMGIAAQPAEETFFIARTAQAGTQAKATR